MAATRPNISLPLNEDTESKEELPSAENTSTELAKAHIDVLPTSKFETHFEFELEADSEPEKFNECFHKINEEFAKVGVLVLKLGKALIEKKKAVGFGNWGSLFEDEEFTFSQRTANFYMSIYENKHLLTGEENSLQQMLNAVTKGRAKTKKAVKFKSYVHKYEMKGYENLADVAQDCGMDESDIRLEIERAIKDRLEQLKGNKSC